MEKQEPLHNGMTHILMRIIIIVDNALTGIGLRQLLEDIIPMADITVCHDFAEMPANTEYVHYFVSSRIYFEHSQFFRDNSQKTIVLVGGETNISGVHTINTCQTEKALVREILTLHAAGHGKRNAITTESHLLSTRETEVAVLLCKGYINKEIAEKLNISQTTVISHRKKIMSKLQARSLADIIIYAVMHGIVDIGEL